MNNANKLSNMKKEFDFIYFSSLPSNKRAGFLRHWLSDDPAKESFKVKNKNQLWMSFVKMSEWECVDKIIEHEYSDINARDENNRGWLHYAIYHSMPDKLSIKGMVMLNNRWNDKDDFNNEPIQISPSPKLANEMARRLWTDISYDKFIFKMNNLKKETDNNELKRIWEFWTLK